MVVEVIRPAQRSAEPQGEAVPEHPVLELIGGAQRLRKASERRNEPLLTPDETLRALRLLAVDSLVDIVHLRETVALQESRIRTLEREVQTWRERAVAEGDARHMEGLASHRRERDLISILHHQMLTTQAMSDELDRRPLRWWRRRKRTA
jgi:hypothetical protein